jgi:hypothetical protein
VVAIIPSDVPGVEAFGRDADASVALLACATIVEASHLAPSLLTLAESYDRDEPAADSLLVEVEDLDASVLPWRLCSLGSRSRPVSC